MLILTVLHQTEHHDAGEEDVQRHGAARAAAERVPGGPGQPGDRGPEPAGHQADCQAGVTNMFNVHQCQAQIEICRSPDIHLMFTWPSPDHHLTII